MTALPQSTQETAGTPCDVEAFRHALRALASGVCIVASRDAAGNPRGIAMTAVMSLSFEPPSMLLAINKTASLLDPLLENGTFSINVLGEDDADWCHQFVTTPVETRFAAEDWDDHASGVPAYRKAIASIICDVDGTDAFGSHMIVRGVVRDAICGDNKRGLIYLDGNYARTAC